MKHFLLFILLSVYFHTFSQIQIGQSINGEATEDNFGDSVSLNADGSVVAIGTPRNDGSGIDSGLVRIYQNTSGSWTQIGQDIDGGAASDQSGFSVSLSSDGNIVAIGAIGNNNVNGNNSGRVRIYQNNSGIWTQVGQDIYGENMTDYSGWSLDINAIGNIVAIGSPFNNGSDSNSGHIRVYQYNGSEWSQIGQDIDGEAESDAFGGSVSLSANGSTVAIGAISNNSNGNNSGHVRVYQYNSGIWSQIGQDIGGEAANDHFGRSVSLNANGNVLAVGANENDGNGTASGHVRIYQYISNIWTQIGQDIDGEAVDDESGWSISLSADGTLIAIGAPLNDGNGTDSGQVRIYQNNMGIWTQIGQDINGEVAGDVSGQSVSLSANSNVLAIGEPGHDGNGINFGQVRLFDLNELLNTNNVIQSSFSLFPNPTKGQFTVKLQKDDILKKINIFNALGQLVKTSKYVTIDVSEMDNGIYLVDVISKNGTATKSLVVQ